MIFKNVGFTDFRNLENTSLEIPFEEIILTGKNGQGKTNFLEALYILCYGSSFRTKNFKDIIKHDKTAFGLYAEDENQKIEFRYENKKKKILLNGREIKDRKELIYLIPCIVFSHGDIEIIRGEPENRRRFFDQMLCMYDVLYFDDLRKYKKILRQRNMAIKNNELSLLSVYNEKLVEYGVPVMKKRKIAVDKFNEIMSPLFKEISESDMNLKINYRASWNINENIIEKLENNTETDLNLRTTTSGPHRDRFIIMDGNKTFISSASTGQVRLTSLVFRSAQMKFFYEKTGKNSVILVDDVLLELDYLKREKYLKSLKYYDQAFFTFLPEEKYTSEKGKKKLYIDVKDGRFTENEK